LYRLSWITVALTMLSCIAFVCFGGDHIGFVGGGCWCSSRARWEQLRRRSDQPRKATCIRKSIADAENNITSAGAQMSTNGRRTRVWLVLVPDSTSVRFSHLIEPFMDATTAVQANWPSSIHVLVFAMSLLVKSPMRVLSMTTMA
jgi:hypothetical protein